MLLHNSHLGPGVRTGQVLLVTLARLGCLLFVTLHSNDACSGGRPCPCLLLTVQQRSDLDGKYGHFLYDPIACREFVCVADTEMLEGSTLPRPINGAGGKPRWSEEDKAKKLSKMMAQGETDPGQCQCYPVCMSRVL